MYITLKNWLSTVAVAAPLTPILKTKIKIGVSITFKTAPNINGYIAALGFPSALIRLLPTMLDDRKINPNNMIDM